MVFMPCLYGQVDKGGMTMFAEWVSAGAIFGMVALVGSVIRAGSGDKDDLDRH